MQTFAHNTAVTSVPTIRCESLFDLAIADCSFNPSMWAVEIREVENGVRWLVHCAHVGMFVRFESGAASRAEAVYAIRRAVLLYENGQRATDE